jgi:type VI secretion system Hcp family effector
MTEIFFQVEFSSQQAWHGTGTGAHDRTDPAPVVIKPGSRILPGKPSPPAVQGPVSDWIEAHSFSCQVSASGLPSTGTAAGRANYSPIQITKRWDAYSPQFFKACSAGEVLKTVTFRFLSKRPDGTTGDFETICIQNARIVSMNQSAEPGESTSFSSMNEVLTFNFSKIQIENNIYNTSMADDLTT